MSASELETVVERLRTAHERVYGEAEARIEGLVGKAESALEDGRTLDHGALARMTRTLSDLAGDAGGETEDAIEAARDAISTYREGVPGA
jgi:phage shock protein A